MKLKIRITSLFIGLLFFVCFNTYAQLESSNWVFGQGVGIAFKSGQPIAFSGTKINTIEGCSTISDNKGNILLYTDGITVWNRNNAIMPNGKELRGNTSATQSTIIVPRPGSNSIFYIFTIDSEGGNGGFRYSLADLSKEQGLGDITLKNKFISNCFTEKLIAVKHTNNVDFWIIVHEYNSDVFLAYLLTKDGLAEKPVMSEIGMKHDKSIYNTIGYMKVSPDKKKLALAINGNRIVQIFDFDPQKGVVTKPVTLKFESGLNPYGLEFSPNSGLLYISIESKGLIYQANLNAGNESSMQKDMCIIGRSKQNILLGALQLGIDGRIYIAEYQSYYLSVINNPNNIGSGCSFRTSAISLGGNVCMLGLPGFVVDFTKTRSIAQKGQPFNNTNKTEINKKYVLNNVYFDFNDNSIRNTEIIELQQLADILIKNIKLNIEIIGHTDSIGDLEYNNKLSFARAQKVRLFLTRNGVAKSRISISGKGSNEPIVSNKVESGRQKNRRVEFILKELHTNNSN